ncbi:MAG TPA: Stp1/IreP family PP2C-type Ser/Thr phosphatase [Gaiellaceae bacterium]|nr:Stp1/IreP family PP2C-type Ser/Thr phosphatase [Gaiellaceae bacterium]
MTVTQLGYGTDTGRKRRRNEDAYVVEPPLFAIADGMGGAQAGELASSLAAGAVREDEAAAGRGERRVAELIQEANRRVYERSSQDAAASGMGTTMTVAFVGEANVAFGHVGDSRAYLIRDGKLEQLTEDHSLVAELVRSGKLSPEEAETHPQRSVITRALGTDPDVDVDTFSIETAPGDLFMLCSDGLTSMVEDDVILRTIEKNRDNLQTAAKALIRGANKGGGEDNITVVFFEIGEDVGEPLEETAQYPALGADGDGELDEDTLDELDRVPALDTMVVPPGEAPQAPEPKRRTRGRLIPALLLILVALAVVAVVLWTLRGR